MGARRLFAAAAVAAVASSSPVMAQEGSAKPSKASKASAGSSAAGLPLLTLSGTYEFLKSSVFLSMDLMQFSALSFVDFTVQQLPPDVQKQVFDVYDDTLSQIDTLRVQNGVPTYSNMKKDFSREWEKSVQPTVDMSLKTVKTYAATPTKILKNVVAKFEKEYPSSKGFISADIFDFSLTILFLVYYVMDFLSNAFCYIFCCGMCAKRKKTASAVPSKVGTTTLANKKKK
jgi:hypothetical protein